MLQIQPEPSAHALVQRFIFTGTVDVNSIASLETLYILPADCSVELDFSSVQRVNSMGLAQLLKLFEHWQTQRINIKITNLNRMIGMLFKMTGLARFINGEQPLTPVVPVSDVQTINTAPITPINFAASHEGKLNLWVNAQNGYQMNGWYFFNTYLQRQLNREIQLELVHGAISEQGKKIEQMDIVFTNPFEATRLFTKHQFRPLVHPSHQTDEVTLLVRVNESRQNISDFNDSTVTTASADNFIYLLGRFLLEESNVTSLDYTFAGSDIKALQTLLKGQADILLMASETYRGLSSLARNMLREIDHSETGFAYHLFCTAPHCTEVGKAVAKVLLNMGQDSQGKQVLTDLGLEGWAKPTQDEINMLAMLFNRYLAENKPQNTTATG